MKFKNTEHYTFGVYVNKVFVLALNEAHSHLEMLRQLIQNKLILEELLKAKGGDEITELIKRIS